MATLLHIKTSLFGDNGQSAQLAKSFVDKWLDENSDGVVIERDLASDPVPHLDAYRVTALNSPAEERDAEQSAIVEFADALLAEVKSADTIVIGLPMYNFNIPSQLKSWFDHLARAGVTFHYTEQGPVGLIEDKPVYLVATRGGLYAEQGQDFQVDFVKQFLGFIGLKDTRLVLAEGLAMDTHRDQSLEQARAAFV
ncbi:MULTISPECIES: FMN-dependent NADH-azoreductase [unclassified Marinobacterium]|jgi:FMN-dependent NADH-azoreductase|uniref:FMN-dependent NADH-azoreductase n=1 Tax=unclassified Marinobacterium TaxID=2644139 RepID=UPI001568CD56|nr:MULTISPECIES: NAD(P)H-dependent oxidoreductase [unclassified Marinobacterium]NRP10344.1 FMN-dependent NADH-azoreductase [Marinobacterium sp. xm-g-48]NRP16127.1 FMN-dependent NADH-azoreductase [Marinobacterium sp. xm-a-152]NRP28344.1 FMN-dependent NADH-azoreductase [Marinobacterium sp. xm-d-420]NRP37235.1 FMN-dependent NADH-azoreductase [Marinobacterium sp. xm-d-579]NRP46954.1 FMN-dependent NADH-azoreductase [Marinobacterium sp. xm-d-543]